jgi:hypothetical protein
MYNGLRTIALCLLFLRGAVPVFAQISYQPATNIEQLISNLFGLQCENIHDVTYVGSPFASGTYSNGEALGIHSGLVLNTGKILNNNQFPADAPRYSESLDMPGDADIDRLSPDESSMDAASISFTFTPTVSDSIFFRYVFASDEYPEYVGSYFNDRFLFLVSENGGPDVNIARLPNGTAVEINNVNSSNNMWYYRANTPDNPNFQTFMFDGYTAPLYAKFYAEAGSSYRIKLVIADLIDGLYNSAIFLDEKESYSSVSGNIQIDQVPAGGGTIEIFDASVFQMFANPLRADVLDGAYAIDSISAGIYHVRYLPDLTLNPAALPVYFSSGTTWEEATVMGLPCYLDGLTMNAENVFLSGPGTISGFIHIDSSYQKSANIPFENAVVLLRNAQTDKLLRYELTDASGFFEFKNLPYGQYEIVPDIPYLPQLRAIVVLNVYQEIITHVDFAVEKYGIYVTVPSVSNIKEADFLLTPNPAISEFVINSRGLVGSDFVVSQTDGTIVAKGTIHSNQEIIDVQQLRSGMYFVKIRKDKLDRTHKLLIIGQ